MTAVGLLLISLVSGAPKLPKTAVFAKVDAAAATGLMMLLVVAIMNFDNDAAVMVVVYSLIVIVVLILIALELGKHRAKKA